MPRHPRFGGRTLARSQAMQILFQAEATGRLVSDVLAGDYALSDGPLDPYASELALGADSMLDDLDAVMDMASANWGVSRMPSVDRNLLRIAIYEMLEVKEVDIPVSIDECVELAKAYGTDESSRFVNGLLGRVAALIEQGEDVVALAYARQGIEVEPLDDDEDGVAEPDEVEDDEVEAESEEHEAADEVEETSDEPADDLPDWAREG